MDVLISGNKPGQVCVYSLKMVVAVKITKDRYMLRMGTFPYILEATGEVTG